MTNAISALFGLAALASALAAQCPIVTDINKLTTPFDSSPSTGRIGEGSSFADGMLRCGSYWYFVASGPGTGAELWKTDGTAAGTMMVKDINPGPTGSDPYYLTCCDGRVFFRAETDAAGQELWVSDGSATGTVMVRDSIPGSSGSMPSNLCCLGRQVLFTATDGVTGFELWISDGTLAGTRILRDIRSGPRSGAPRDLKQNLQGTQVLFQADDGLNGSELWTTDGTVAGTVLLVDLKPGAGSSSPTYFIADPGDPRRTLFRADDGLHGAELWRTDGTAAGTVLVSDIRPGPEGSHPRMYYSRHAVLGGLLFFDAADGVHGNELWATDGTAAGTFLVQDIDPGPAHGDPTGFRVSGGELYMQACTARDGCELFRLSATSFGLVRDLQRGAGSSSPEEITALPGGGVLFSADTGATGSGRELWVSNGTNSGTRLLADIWAGAADGEPEAFTPLLPGGRILFFATDGRSDGPGRELFETDGSPAGTRLFKDLHPGGESNSSAPSFLTGSRGSTLLFSADDGESGREPWRTDAGGTTLLLDIHAGPTGSDPAGFIDLWTGSELLTIFSANDGRKGEELWVTDGTAAGTTLLVDIERGRESSGPNNFGRLGGRVFFSARTAATGYELWVTDGTAAGTSLVKDIEPGSTSSTPHALTAVGDTLFFAALAHSTTGLELWRTDGTPAGTMLVKDIRPGSVGSSPRYLTPFGDTLLFRANDGSSGVELWRSDGTAQGTMMVSEIATGSYGGHPTELTRFGDFVYFAATESASGTELWRTDGTARGTILLRDIQAGASSSRPGLFTVSQGRLFFRATQAATGTELYVSDGTAAGTMLAADIQPGLGGSSPIELVAAGDGVYFSAQEARNGRELFFSDGTVAGTRRVCDLYPGPESSNPYGMVGVDGRLYFRAIDHRHGYEVFRLGSTPALVERFGASCGSVAPTLDATQPVLGGICTLSGTGPAVGLHILIWGVRGTPFAMPGTLAPDCAMWGDLGVAITLLLPAGTMWSVPLAVPAQASLVGVQVLLQSVAESVPLSASNAVQLTLGR